MQSKHDQNKEMTLSLNTCNGIPIATKGPLKDTLHFEKKSLIILYGLQLHAVRRKGTALYQKN